MRDEHLAREKKIVARMVRDVQQADGRQPAPRPDTETPRRVYKPEPRIVEGHATPRQTVPLDPDLDFGSAIPAQRRRRERNTDAATALRNIVRALGTQLVTTLPISILIGVILGLVVNATTGSAVFAWIAGALPAAGWLAWMILWSRQARDHWRGDAGPPPGWLGRGL